MTATRTAFSLALALALACLVALGGCSPEVVTCAKGSVVVDGKCAMPSSGSCGAGTVWDPAAKLCVLAPGDAGDGGTGGGDVVDAGDSADTADSGGDEDVPVDVPIGVTPDVSCTPNCDGRVCGNDGCGGSCGTCPNLKVCDTTGQCLAPPDCYPSCMNKVCGDDGCGGSCGTCKDASKPICDKGSCLAGCVPDCVGKGCGPDGCGGTCGNCSGETACSAFGHCVAKAWTCPAAQFKGNDGCHCGCGAHDPDCDLAGAVALGCGADQVCKDGACADKVPKAWTCAPFLYDDGLLCNCTCGAKDPDCDDAANLIVDCTKGGCSKDAGVCLPCKPDCSGKSCGDDGCGGTCGTCKEPGKLGCQAGQCVSACTPDCKNKECGSDGCGGSCGTCSNKELICSAGVCTTSPDKSCLGSCGYQTSGGCWCDAGCKDRGDCCLDVHHCFCTPDCKGKACGPDGCGASCGACTDGAKPYCDAGACSATCKPNCQGKACGSDGCGGSCGNCSADASCTDWGACVPHAWTCQPYHYGSGGPLATCDCSCGVADPDCKGKGPIVGCPGATSCAPDKSTCAASWCASQSACNAPSWCVGHYPSGDGLRKGVCAPPDPLGAAPGAPCTTDDSCATGICVAFTCRIHCVVDAHCPSGQGCTGSERILPLTGQPVGVLGTCNPAGAVGKSCGANKDCAADELCLAYVEPKTLGVLARCGIPYGGAPEGLSCKNGVQCQQGLLCHQGSCVRPCHGGVADCAPGKSCLPAVLHHGATPSPDDDVKVPACLAAKPS